VNELIYDAAELVYR